MNKICTNIEQSKRLIELGVDVNTADMFWDLLDGDKLDEKIPNCYPDRFDISNEKFVLAWSFTALIDLLPSDFDSEGKLGKFNYQVHMRKYRFIEDINLYQIAYGNYGQNGSWKDMINTGEHEEMIDAVFEMVCWLLENKKI